MDFDDGNAAALYGAMKKRSGLGRAVSPVPRSHLEASPTGALLARLKRLQWCEENPLGSDLSDEEITSASHLILFKSDEAWRAAYAELKDVLANREHVAKKPWL
jgi:hypothetical protein